MVPGNSISEFDLQFSTIDTRFYTSEIFNTRELVSIFQACVVNSVEPLPMHFPKAKESMTPFFIGITTN